MSNQDEYRKRELMGFLGSKACYFDTPKEFIDQLTVNGREWIEEQLEWIENGTYGAGACLALGRAFAGLTPRCNAKARIGGVLLHALYGKPFRYWNKMPKGTQDRINGVVDKWIRKASKSFAIT